MNAYDFDGTIYKGDVTLDFYLYALFRNPTLIITIPVNLINACLFIFKKISREDFKERYFKLILPHVDGNRLVEEFWNKRQHCIRRWYLLQSDSRDVVVSASPEFILSPMCRELGVKLIATKVDPNTGEFIGPNLRGKEKVRAWKARYPHERPEAYYTDSMSDQPMVEFAEAGYIVRGEQIQNFWES